MNLQQRLFLWLGMLAFSLLTLRPPWIEVYASPFGDSGVTHYESRAGTEWIWRAKASGPYRYLRVDFERLALEWSVVAAITGALLWTCNGSPSWHPWRGKTAAFRSLGKKASGFFLSRRNALCVPDADLKPLSPEAAWLMIQCLVVRAKEDHYEQAESLARKMNMPGDLDDLVVFLCSLEPTEAMKDFQDANPDFPINRDMMRGDPLKALAAVLKTLLEGDRFQSCVSDL